MSTRRESTLNKPRLKPALAVHAPRRCAPRVRVLTPAPRAATPSRRATFEFGAPRMTLNPWGTTRDWRASRPKFFAGVILAFLFFALYQMFNNDLFFVNDTVLSGNKIVPRGEVSNTAGVHGWNIFFVEPLALEARLRAMPEFKDVQVDITCRTKLTSTFWSAHRVSSGNRAAKIIGWTTKALPCAPAVSSRMAGSCVKPKATRQIRRPCEY